MPVPQKEGIIFDIVKDNPRHAIDHLVDINFTPGQAPRVTKVQPMGKTGVLQAPANFAENEAVSMEDDGVAVNSKPPPKRDPKTGKPVPLPAPPATKEQVQIPTKAKPPSKEKALAEGNLELSKIKETVRGRLNNGVAMSHQEREFVKKNFKETFGEELFASNEGKGFDADHDGNDDSVWNRVFHTSHSQVDDNSLY